MYLGRGGVGEKVSVPGTRRGGRGGQCTWVDEGCVRGECCSAGEWGTCNKEPNCNSDQKRV